MSTNRLSLHEVLCGIMGEERERQVYFQPPETIRMTYPAIVYERYDFDKIYADNASYHTTPAYQITVIDPDPDSEIVEAVKDLPMCTFDRHFAAENLNHDVFTVYYNEA